MTDSDAARDVPARPEAPAEKAPAEKAPTKQTAAKKTGTKKTSTKKTGTKKTGTKQAPAEKAPAEPTPPPDDHDPVGVDPDAVTEVLPIAPPMAAEPEPETEPETVSVTDAAAEPSRLARARALAERLRTRGEDEYDRLQERRADSRTIDSVFGAVEHDTEVGGGILAGAVAFRLFLFMVPFVFVLVVAFGVGTGLAGDDTRTAARSAGAIGLLAKNFASVAGRSTWDRIVGLVVGSFALFLTARAALAGNVLNASLWYRDHPRPEGWYGEDDDA